jgi:hypothetical protein
MGKSGAVLSGDHGPERRAANDADLSGVDQAAFGAAERDFEKHSFPCSGWTPIYGDF